MKFSEYKYLIYSDLYRITGNIKFVKLIRHIFIGAEYKYIFWMRTTRYAKSNLLLKYTIYPLAKMWLFRLRFKYGIRISPFMDLGSGLFITHFGGVNVSVNSKIGKNFNISQQVTIGKANRGKRKGCPVFGDNVYIGPGARILGNIRIGNNVAIGANCVVTKDIPDNSVVVGIPAKVISQKGSKGYVNRTDYDKILSKFKKVVY